MRHIHLLVVGILVLVLSVPVLALDSNVIVSNYSVTPSILMPGEKGIIKVTLSDTGPISSGSIPQGSEADTSSSVIESVFLDGKKDIDVLEGNGQFEGRIGTGQSIGITFVVQAPPSAGLYFAELLIRIRNQESIRYPVAINVNTPISEVRQPALILAQSSSGPIRPGESLPITITLDNEGVSQAKDITVRIKETGPSIAPLYSGTFHVERLNQGAHISEDIVLSTDKDAISGIHKIPIEISYTTPDKGQTVAIEMISLEIRGEADLSITALETSPSRILENSPYDMIVRLDNSGTGDADSVRASLDLPFSGGKDAFVGRIEPKSDAPAVFMLQSGEAGEYPYHLDFSYRDDWGDHQKSENLTVIVTKPGDGTIPLLILVILGIIGYAGYRFWIRRGDT